MSFRRDSWGDAKRDVVASLPWNRDKQPASAAMDAPATQKKATSLISNGPSAATGPMTSTVRPLQKRSLIGGGATQ